ncbi:hypothetical protein [Asaia krungthepensis]|uniref:hypothetical protein n=1 Tax=Asaia krungthepensis TaxID=220990 RepID=UPI00222EB063|nr:hypothetical protein [Asaia krungthepensis]
MVRDRTPTSPFSLSRLGVLFLRMNQDVSLVFMLWTPGSGKAACVMGSKMKRLTEVFFPSVSEAACPCVRFSLFSAWRYV